MMHKIAPSTINMSSSLLPSATKKITATTTAKTTSTSSSGTTTSGTSTTTGATTDIGATFLNLLTQELQNQDPTDPVDSTAMVGQMISLNQLDQLIGINQALGGNAGATSLTPGEVSGSAGTAQAQAATSLGAQPQPAAAVLPFNTNPISTQTSLPS